MTKNRIALLLLALLAVAGLVFMFVPTVPIVTETDAGLRAPPDPAERIEVSDPLLVLPSRAGDPAFVQMEITNVSNGSLVVTDVAVRKRDDSRIFNLETPARSPIAALQLDEGETVSFGALEDRAILANYDSTMVPGAEVDLLLILGDGEAISVPMTVGSMVGQGGEVQFPPVSPR